MERHWSQHALVPESYGLASLNGLGAGPLHFAATRW